MLTSNLGVDSVMNYPAKDEITIIVLKLKTKKNMIKSTLLGIVKLIGSQTKQYLNFC